MSCPAVEHGKAINAALNSRLAELWGEIEKAGVSDQVVEIIRIRSNPESAFSQLMERRRLARKLVSFTG